MLNPIFTSSTSPSEGDRLEGGFVVTERVEDRIVAAEMVFTRRAYAATREDGQVVTGSAAEPGEVASPRAFGELLERAATLAAMRRSSLVTRDAAGEETGSVAVADVFRETGDHRSRFARSNGVALAADWPGACDAATLEMIERDAILRSWLGETAPIPLDDVAFPATSRYAWRAVALPIAPAWRGELVAEVVFVCAFPLERGAPLLRGSACRPTRAGAVDAALREALQGLAFLWGEEIPEETPPSVPTAIFHLDHYLCEQNHPRLRAWLDGRRFTGAPTRWTDAQDPRIRWADVTPEDATYRVAVAWSDAAIPLVFGAWPATFDAPGRAELEPHPIA